MSYFLRLSVTDLRRGDIRNVVVRGFTGGVQQKTRCGGVGWAVMRTLRFAHEPDASRYTLHRGDNLVSVLDYRDDGRSVAMTRAYTVPTFRGHGYAGEVVARAVAELEAQGDRVVIPVCWYVADWFAAHPERSDILARRAG